MSYPKSLDDWSDEIHRWAVSKGWWESPRNKGELIALVHSEASEALEEWRMGRIDTWEHVDELGVTKPEGFYIELADVVIRVMDIFAADGESLETAIRRKMQYNETRAYRHGGKLA